MSCFTYNFVSDCVTIYKRYYLLSLCKSRTCYYINDIIKFEGFDCDNCLIDEKSHKHNLIYDISYKTLIDPKALRVRFNQLDVLIGVYEVRNMMPFTIGLDIL